MRHKWLAFFILLFVLFFLIALNAIINPSNIFGIPFTPTAQDIGFESGEALVGSFLGAAVVTIVLRILYVGLKGLFR